MKRYWFNEIVVMETGLAPHKIEVSGHHIVEAADRLTGTDQYVELDFSTAFLVSRTGMKRKIDPLKITRLEELERLIYDAISGPVDDFAI